VIASHRAGRLAQRRDLHALIAFLSVAVKAYFFVVVPIYAIKEGRSAYEEATHRECPECLSEIPNAARRCAHCKSELEPA
jgi:large conductance mechanosensitive channel